MNFALSVTTPCSTGLGGDCFILYFNDKDSKVYGLNGSGRSPMALNLEKAIEISSNQSNDIPKSLS